MMTIGEVDHLDGLTLDLDYVEIQYSNELCRLVNLHLLMNSYPALVWSLSALLVIEMIELESWLTELIEFGRATRAFFVDMYPARSVTHVPEELSISIRFSGFIMHWNTRFEYGMSLMTLCRR